MAKHIVKLTPDAPEHLPDAKWIPMPSRSNYHSWSIFTRGGHYQVLDASAPDMTPAKSKARAIFLACAPRLFKTLESAPVPPADFENNTDFLEKYRHWWKGARREILEMAESPVMSERLLKEFLK